MRFLESQIPQAERLLIAGYIDSASAACPIRRRYYQTAQREGMIAALRIIENHEGHQPEMLAILREKLNGIGRRLYQVEPLQ